MTALYCDAEEVRKLARGAGNDNKGTAAELSDDQILLAIEQASGVISSYVGTDYEVDQYNDAVVVPQLVKSLALDLSLYYATLMYRKGKSLDEFDPVYLRYRAAVAIFQDLISGKIQADPKKPGHAASVTSRVINTVPGVFTTRDSGTRISNGEVRPEGWYGSGW